MIVNPLGEKPLPANFFNGTYDQIRAPEVIDK